MTRAVRTLSVVGAIVILGGIGLALADQMTIEQLDEFELFTDANDEVGALNFLETNFPNYKQVVNDKFVELTEEVRLMAPQILAAG